MTGELQLTPPTLDSNIYEAAVACRDLPTRKFQVGGFVGTLLVGTYLAFPFVREQNIWTLSVSPSDTSGRPAVPLHPDHHIALASGQDLHPFEPDLPIKVAGSGPPDDDLFERKYFRSGKQGEPTPCPNGHTVRPGDGLMLIAGLYGMTYEELLQLNPQFQLGGNRNPHEIFEGDIIRVNPQCAPEATEESYSTPVGQPTASFPGNVGAAANSTSGFGGAANTMGGGGVPEGVRSLDTKGLFTMLTALGGFLIVALGAAGFYTLAAKGNQFLHPQKKR